MYVCMSCSDFLKFLFLVNSIVCLSGTPSVWKIRRVTDRTHELLTHCKNDEVFRFHLHCWNEDVLPECLGFEFAVCD